MTGLIIRGNDAWAEQARALVAGMNPRTRRAYLGAYRRYREWCEVNGCDPYGESTVYRYFTEKVDGGMRAGSLSMEYGAVMKLSRLCGVDGWNQARLGELRRGLMRRCTEGKGARALELAELGCLLDACNGSVRGRALLLLGYGGGFRLGELLGLRERDVHFDGDMACVHLVSSKGDRTGSGVDVWVGPYGGWDLVAEVAPLVGGGVDSLFGWRETSFRRWWCDLVRRCGLSGSGLTPHSLRVGCATAAVRGGVSLAVLQRHLRHRSASTTARYYRESEGQTTGRVVAGALSGGSSRAAGCSGSGSVVGVGDDADSARGSAGVAVIDVAEPGEVARAGESVGVSGRSGRKSAGG